MTISHPPDPFSTILPIPGVVTIVVAMDRNRGIGYQNRLPWHLPADLRHFRQLTIEKADGRGILIMGRNTWESLPRKPLPDRTHYVVTSQPLATTPGVISCPSLPGAIAAALATSPYVFIIGGAKLYESAMGLDMPLHLVVTHIDATYPCDRYFPPIPPSFRKIQTCQPTPPVDVTYHVTTYQP